MNKIKNEEEPEYITIPDVIAEQRIIDEAIDILTLRMCKPNTYITCPDDIKRYATIRLAQLEHEVFAVVMLDNKHGVISYQELFRGTIDGASVHPREVVKEALKWNASAVIFVHNHPSGNPEQSQADEQITIRLQKALALVDIRVLDHLIVGGTEVTSLAVKGIL